jgi:putative DNA primase/helicase
MTGQLASALYYAERGWAVVPCDGKQPTTAHGWHDASANAEQIRAWWHRWPRANVGIAPGASGLVVIDVDVKDGSQGLETWRDLVQAHGGALEATLCVETPSGGLHFYFARPAEALQDGTNALGPGIDVIAGRRIGVVIAPPSSLPEGGAYGWAMDCAPTERRLEPLPAALVALLGPKPRAARPRPQRQAADDTDTARRALSHLEGWRCEVYSDPAGGWLEVGMALSALGDTGLELWDAWSQGCPAKYRAEVCAEKWASFRPEAGLSIGSLIYWADQDAPGWRDKQDPDTSLHCTDMGNAQRFAALAVDRLLYVFEWGWLYWNGRRWARDTVGEAQRIARQVPSVIYREAAAAAPGSDNAKSLGGWALATENAGRLRAMLELAESEPALRASADDFDREPMLLNCQNGVLDLATGTLRPHQPSARLTKLAPVVYQPGATHPTWTRYLATATGGDGELAAYLQRAAGYSLTGRTDEEVVFLVLGPEASGKTTLAEALLGVLGIDGGGYGRKIAFSTLLEQRSSGGGPRPDIASLAGIRLAVACEAEAGQRLNAVAVKELSGGDTVTARFLYRDEFSFKPQVKLWLATNESPRMRDDDSALWRRLRRLPFEHTIPAAERDPQVKLALTTDAAAQSAVLAWAVAGCKAWQKQGLGYPETVRRKTAELRAEFDPLGEFFATCCIFAPRAEVGALDLRRAYERWAGEMGARPLTDRQWGARLRAKGCEDTRKRIDGQRRALWLGIGLLAEQQSWPVSTLSAQYGIFGELSREEVIAQKLAENGLLTGQSGHPGNGSDA